MTFVSPYAFAVALALAKVDPKGTNKSAYDMRQNIGARVRQGGHEWCNQLNLSGRGGWDARGTGGGGPRLRRGTISCNCGGTYCF